MTAPAGLPSLLKLGQVARVLGLGERTVRGWLERGLLPSIQPTGQRGGRWVARTDLEAYAARCGLSLDWTQAL